MNEETMTQNNEQLQINCNVIFELGYALGLLEYEKIFCFVNDKSFKDYKKLKPSLLDSINIKTYNDMDDIFDFIDKKYKEQNNFFFEDKTLNEYVIEDKICVSMLKMQLNNELNKLEYNDIPAIDNLIHNYMNNYKHYDIHECLFLYIFNCEFIDKEKELIIIFFRTISNFMDFGCEWIKNHDNQIRIIKFLDKYNYNLNIKTVIIDNDKFNIMRREYIILCYEFLKYKKFKLFHELKKIIINLLNDKKLNNDYKKFIELLNCKFKNILSITLNEELKNQIYYEDLILNNNNVFNKW